MTVYTLVRSGRHGAEGGVRAVVVGGDGGPEAEGGTVVATLEPALEGGTARAVVGEVTWLFAPDGLDRVARWESDTGSWARMRSVDVPPRDHEDDVDRAEVDLDGRAVVRNGSLPRTLTEDGVLIGTSDDVGFGFSVPVLTVVDDLPVAGAVFLLWLEWLLARRRASGWRLQQIV